MADKMSIDKADLTQHHHNHNHHHHPESDESPESSPGRDQNSAAPSANATSQEAQQPKRKGGRKPVSIILFRLLSTLDAFVDLPRSFTLLFTMALIQLSHGDKYPLCVNLDQIYACSGSQQDD